MNAKKSLGQHFLHSEKALSQIVEAGNIQPDDVVLEIGPGRGALTKRLVAVSRNVIAIEKDQALIPLLQETFAAEIAVKKLQLIEADVLDFDPSIVAEPYKLIANIPYYITGAIIEQFLSTKNQPSRMVLLVQKEVADRIIARDGKASIPSIAVRAYGAPKLIAKVPAGAFNPPPKVDSAILLIENINRSFFTDCDESLFLKTLKAVFGKKRKQIGGSLGEFLGDKARALHILSQCAIDSKTRPEDIELATWKTLVQTIQNSKNGVQ